MFLNKKSWIVTFFILGMHGIIMTSCQDKRSLDGNPKEVIRGYIEKSFNINKLSDRKVLEAYLTGETRKKLEAWSDAQFIQAFVENKRKFIRLAFKELKPVNNQEVTITYELTYLDQGPNHEARVTNKKLATLIEENQRWKIKKVKNLKELIEFKDEMSLP